MRTGAHEVELISIDLIDQEEVATDVTFTVITPFPFQGMIEPLWTKRGVVSNQQQHRLFQLTHVVTSALGKFVPILGNLFGVACCAWEGCSFSACGRRHREP